MLYASQASALSGKTIRFQEVFYILEAWKIYM